MTAMEIDNVSYNMGYRNRPFTPADRPIEGSNNMQFTISKHSKEAFEVMNALRHHGGRLCDVTLQAGDKVLVVHKIVLAASSPYFHAMFCTSGMKESDLRIIPLHNVNPTALETLVDFAYTSTLHLNEANVCTLLAAGTMFQMSHVVEACCTFLENQLDASNCIGIADFAIIHGCHELYNKAKLFIYKNFSDVFQHEEFLQLSATQLIQVIKRDELNVRCESVVFEAVLRWIEFNEKERLGKFDHLLSAVRCHFLRPQFLTDQLRCCDLLSKAPQCREYLIRVLQDLKLHKRIKERRRNPASPIVIYCVGGYFRHSLNNVECYNPGQKQWYKVAPLPVPRSGVAVCCLEGLLYVIGGRNNSSNEENRDLDSAAVNCYSPVNNVWRKCADMCRARNRVGCTHIDGLIYAVGGSHGANNHDSVERYNPEKDEWSDVCPMSTRRIGMGVLSMDRIMYVVGGFDGCVRLNSMERYDPDLNEWLALPPMNHCRSGAGVVAMDQYIYVVGGYDGVAQLSSAERYNVDTSQWELITPMPRPRSALGLCAIQGKLYAIGGYDGSDFLASVEHYNADREEWEEVSVMSCGRSGHGVTAGPEPTHNNDEQ